MVPFQAEVSAAVAHWSRELGVTIDPALVHAILERESGHATNPAYVRNGGIVPEPGGHHSYGPMQLYDDTIRTQLKLGFPPEDLATHPALGIWYGTKFLGMLLARAKGDVKAALAHWNTGPTYWTGVSALWDKYRKQLATAAVPVLALAALAVWILARRRRAA
jgi:soluble lytic murein transglycosylase-like protein